MGIFDRYGGNDPFQTTPALPENNRSYVLTDQAILPETESRLGQVIRSLDEFSEEEISGATFFVCFECDSDALALLQKIISLGGKFRPAPVFDKTSYRFANRLAYEALRKTWAKADRVSHLDPRVHENVCEALELTRNIKGDYVEIGVYLGGSALTALNYLDQIGFRAPQHRQAWLLDTFDGFTFEEAETSVDPIWSGTHKLLGADKTIAFLTQTFEDCRTKFNLVKSNICADPVPDGIGAISVLNVDVDMYEPTVAIFEKCAHLVSPGGIIVCEDPSATPALYGAFLAMKHFLGTHLGQCFTPVFKPGGYFLLRSLST